MDSLYSLTARRYINKTTKSLNSNFGLIYTLRLNRDQSQVHKHLQIVECMLAIRLRLAIMLSQYFPPFRWMQAIVVISLQLRWLQQFSNPKLNAAALTCKRWAVIRRLIDIWTLGNYYRAVCLRLTRELNIKLITRFFSKSGSTRLLQIHKFCYRLYC